MHRTQSADTYTHSVGTWKGQKQKTVYLCRMTGPMEIPVIDLSGLNGGDEQRSRTLAELHDACKDWGFFWVSNNESYTYIAIDKFFLHASCSSPI